MSDTLNSAAGTTGVLKPMWIVVGLLSAAVVALGGTLLYQQGKQAASAAAPAQQASISTPVASTGSQVPALARDDEVAAPAPSAQKTTRPAPAAPHTPKPVHAPSQRATHANTAQPKPAANASMQAPIVVQPAPRPICRSCGSVERVTAAERAGQASGLGAIGGGVVGAALGNQIGHGNGRAAATVAGAVGGGLLGNAVEKRVKQQTVFQISVRMEDGSLRTVERAASLPVGTQVTLQGDELRTADGALVPAGSVTR